LPVPLLGGTPWAKNLFAVCMVGTIIACLLLERMLRNPGRYRFWYLLAGAAVCVTAAYSGVVFFGAYSPAPVVIPFGLYFFGLSRSFRGTLVIYAVCALGYAGLTIPPALGWYVDPGLVTAPHLSTTECLLVVAGVQTVFLATYVIARLSRRATEHALAMHDVVVRELAGRDALLNEARMDLDRVLRARGLGRYTGEIVGGYQLGQIIGRGGMGEVYDAIHLDSETVAAVKLLHPQVLEEPDNVQRFFRECRSAAALDEPHVVKVFETSQPTAAIPFIAMERLYGTDLSDMLRQRGRLRRREVLRLIREVGSGLDAARRAEIVHRDIKPRNLFLAEAPSGAKRRRSVWKILDFGVSKLASDATLTRKNLVGTPSYMAPEQASGEEVSHRTDLFSLAVIAYRALTGRPAFTGDSAMAILYQVVNDMPPQPTVVARVAPQFDDVFAIALAKDPWERFDSATEFADALEKAARGRLPKALRERGQRLVRTSPWGQA
jgi:serine/threonine-protein kinase